MVLEANVPDEPLRFVLKSSDPMQQATFLAQANSIEEKQGWIAQITDQLDLQKKFLEAISNPKAYQDRLAGSMGGMNL